MAVTLAVRPQQLEALSVLRDLGSDGCEALVQRLSHLDSSTMRVAELRAAIEPAVGGDRAKADATVRLLLSLYGLRRQRALGAAETVAGITEAIRALPASRRWSKEQLQAWTEASPALEQLLGIAQVSTVAKALDLAFEYQNLLQTARILTDIRPVYSEAGDQIVGVVVSQTLSLYYDSAGMDHRLSVAVDEQDIRRLKEACERALVKAQTARQLLADRAQVRALIAGEESDES